ncbi:MAG: hypothetical protein J5730_05165 [Bacteroidales bacterium]|nr:hypothetical protein [Bacteroidales bacterium]
MHTAKPRALYLFNPEHDYALANNSEHFVPLQSAVQFARDCAPFVRYLADAEEALLFNPYDKQPHDLSTLEDVDIRPWGWDRLMRRQLRAAGLAESLLPTDSQLDSLRDLAHRQITIPAMDFLRRRCPDLPLPVTARRLTRIDEVEGYIAEWKDCIFKSPYSGNGRGNLYAHGEFSSTLRRQCAGVLRRQGALLAEPLYNVVQDFAMEFVAIPEEVRFCGYSLFRTQHYGYAGNELRPDPDIVRILSQWIDTNTLESIQTALKEFIQEVIQPHYHGCVGVDMFVYEADGYKLNPMVEINLRMTMGMAAHLLYERHVHPNATGLMRIEYRPARGEMLQYVQQQPAMASEDGRWREGFLALTPVTEETQYCVTVELRIKN